MFNLDNLRDAAKDLGYPDAFVDRITNMRTHESLRMAYEHEPDVTEVVYKAIQYHKLQLDLKRNRS